GDKRESILIGGWRVSDRKFDGVVLEDETGLRSQVYERDLGDGNKEYVYATAGTNDGQDVIADMVQPFAQSEQYHNAAENAKAISKELAKEDAELTYTGHSLGGG